MSGLNVKPVGFIYRYDDRFIYVNLTDENYRPGLGDLLYVKPGEGAVIILQVAGFAGEIPTSPLSISREVLFEPALFSLGKQNVVKTTLFLEIRSMGGGFEVFKPYQPPPLSLPVYRFVKGEKESNEIMKTLSEGIKHSSEGATKFVPIAWLRAGVAPVKSMRDERYFKEAPLKVSLTDMVSKHILVVGQTGSGKTTGVMGILVQWCNVGSKDLSWIIIDRHGEYSRSSLIQRIRDSLHPDKGVFTIYVVKVGEIREEREKVDGVVKQVATHIDVSSVTLNDLYNVLIGREDRIHEIEEVLNTITSTLIVLEEVFGERVKPLINVFMENEEVNGNVLALIPVLVDNVVRFEGIGERERKGLYRELLNVGVDIKKLRAIRNIILQTLGLRLIYKNGVKIIDDSRSVFKVSVLLKDPDLLRKFLSLFILIYYATKEGAKGSRIQAEGLKEVHRRIQIFVSKLKSTYPWFHDNAYNELEEIIVKVSIPSNLLSIGKVVEEAENNGRIIVLDVSKVPHSFADLISTVIARRVFENRLLMGVENVANRHVIAIVSEEAPLYLSPDQVKNPFNAFARIAREGRKFKIGLIAISQIATIIERQILANFNTVIVLRTKHPSDLNYFSEIGVPSENVPMLSDREGFLYTPDLNVKEPIPVYIPGYFEVEVEGGKQNPVDLMKKLIKS